MTGSVCNDFFFHMVRRRIKALVNVMRNFEHDFLIVFNIVPAEALPRNSHTDPGSSVDARGQRSIPKCSESAGRTNQP